MRTCLSVIIVTFLFCLSQPASAADAPSSRSVKEALQPFNGLIGVWRCTATPEGTQAERQRGFWIEGQTWQWQFKGDDAWLRVAIDKGKYFTGGELRYLPSRDLYQLTLRTAEKEALTFTGKLQNNRLVVERADEKKKENQRVTVSLLHANRFLYGYEVSPQDRPSFKRQYLVGCTREGVDFASGDGKPECIVSGGLGTMAVTYKGETYYVCCSGCRDAFNEEPEKYIKEFKERKAREKK
jgi:hypothetical protein